MPGRPEKARAAPSAIMLASVPLLVKRTRSSEGKRAQSNGCELAFPFPDRREIEAAIDGGVQGGLDARLGMAEQSRRVLAAEVDVAVTVHVLEEAALAARHRCRERRIEQHRARVAAGQDAARALMDPGALGARRGIALPGLRQRLIEIAVSLSRQRPCCISICARGRRRATACPTLRRCAKLRRCRPRHSTLRRRKHAIEGRVDTSASDRDCEQKCSVSGRSVAWLASLPLAGRSLRERVSAEEWSTRVDLAACYRLVALYGMTDLVYNHITARVPGADTTSSSIPTGCCTMRSPPRASSRSISRATPSCSPTTTIPSMPRAM